MILRRITFVWLLAVIVSSLLVGGAYATPYRITALDDPTNQYGWQTHSARCWGAKGGILSYINAGAVGTPGPAPGANLGFECSENGTLGGTDQPGNSWTGTDRYVGTKLTDIKKISYWAIVDWRGVNTFSMMDGSGIKVVNEWRVHDQSSQPPTIVLMAYKSPPGNLAFRTLVYRPWSSIYPGIGPTSVGINAVQDRKHRIWREYNALEDGLWYVSPVTLTPEHPTGMYTWSELVAMYPNATLATPIVAENPTWGESKAPIPTSFNLHMGAMANSNNDWIGIGREAWWYESYWGRGAADLVTVVRDTDPGAGETLVEETFDFDVGTAVAPSYIRPLSVTALNNLALYDQTVYMPGMWPPDVLPNKRTRARASGAVAIPWAQGSVENEKMNALQKAGTYGVSHRQSGGAVVPDSETVNMYALYGKICGDAEHTIVYDNNQGVLFYVDDGTGRKIPCYCPGAVYESTISEGNYVRLVGSVQGNNPNEWYWNQFHYVEWKPGFPVGCAMSKPFHFEFQTFTWNITVLN